jgi:hypothetical protein
MQILRESGGMALHWVQPDRAVARFVLRRGTAELATFARDPQRPTLVRARVGAASWLFVGQQLFDPALKIYAGTTRVAPTAARPLAWMDSECQFPELRLLFADGQCYYWLWQRKALHVTCTCRAASAPRQEVLRIQMPAFQSTTACLQYCTLLLFPAARDLPALPLLVALSPYLLLLGQEQQGPLPRWPSLPGEEVAEGLVEFIATVLGELLGHLHIYSAAG